MRRLTEDKKGLATDRERHMKSSKEGKPSREDRPTNRFIQDLVMLEKTSKSVLLLLKKSTKVLLLFKDI